jgi:hypothetical protein
MKLWFYVAFTAKFGTCGIAGFAKVPVTAHALPVKRLFEINVVAGIVARTAENLFIAFFKQILVEDVLSVLVKIVVALKAIEFPHVKLMGKVYGRAMLLPIRVGIVQHEVFFLSEGGGRGGKDHQQQSQNDRRPDMVFQ